MTVPPVLLTASSTCTAERVATISRPASFKNLRHKWCQYPCVAPAYGCRPSTSVEQKLLLRRGLQLLHPYDVDHRATLLPLGQERTHGDESRVCCISKWRTQCRTQCRRRHLASRFRYQD